MNTKGGWPAEPGGPFINMRLGWRSFAQWRWFQNALKQPVKENQGEKQRSRHYGRTSQAASPDGFDWIDEG
jgi:hypothetical protein